MIRRFFSKGLFAILGVVLMGTLFLGLGANLNPVPQNIEPGTSQPATNLQQTATPSPVTNYKPVVEPQVIQSSSQPVPKKVVIRFAPQANDEQRQAYVDEVGGTVVESIDSLDTVVVDLL